MSSDLVNESQSFAGHQNLSKQSTELRVVTLSCMEERHRVS